MASIFTIANKEFIIVFEPYEPENYSNRKRFAVGAGQLWKYVGAKNAITALKLALNNKTDIFTKRYRSHGRIDFYSK